MGVVMYILVSGKVPFPGRNEMEIIGNVIKGEFHFNHDAFNTVSEDCKDLICHLLVKDVNKRFTAEEALNHRWIQKYSEEASKTELPSGIYEEMKEVIEEANSKKATITYLAAKLPESDF
jgi:serine/threonine protein kinase